MPGRPARHRVSGCAPRGRHRVRSGDEDIVEQQRTVVASRPHGKAAHITGTLIYLDRRAKAGVVPVTG